MQRCRRSGAVVLLSFCLKRHTGGLGRPEFFCPPRSGGHQWSELFVLATCGGSVVGAHVSQVHSQARCQTSCSNAHGCMHMRTVHTKCITADPTPPAGSLAVVPVQKAIINGKVLS